MSVQVVQTLSYQEIQNINDNLLDSLIVDLGLKDHHLVPDPACFICRQSVYQQTKQMMLQRIMLKSHMKSNDATI